MLSTTIQAWVNDAIAGIFSVKHFNAIKLHSLSGNIWRKQSTSRFIYLLALNKILIFSEKSDCCNGSFNNVLFMSLLIMVKKKTNYFQISPFSQLSVVFTSTGQELCKKTKVGFRFCASCLIKQTHFTKSCCTDTNQYHITISKKTKLILHNLNIECSQLNHNIKHTCSLLKPDVCTRCNQLQLNCC